MTRSFMPSGRSSGPGRPDDEQREGKVDEEATDRETVCHCAGSGVISFSRYHWPLLVSRYLAPGADGVAESGLDRAIPSPGRPAAEQAADPARRSSVGVEL